MIKKCLKLIQDIKNTSYEEKLNSTENVEVHAEVFDDRRFSNELLDFRTFSLSSFNSIKFLYLNHNSRIHWGFGVLGLLS